MGFKELATAYAPALASVALLACGSTGAGAADDDEVVESIGPNAGSSALDVDMGDAAVPAEGGATDGAGPAVCAACDGSCVETLSIETAAHINGPIAYPDTPPAGGNHGPCWADYGVYDDPALPPERFVHNLEHGAVVFLYHCPGGCEDQVSQLAELVAELPRTMLTPYPDMPEGFGAVAWGQRLVSDCLDMSAMRDFYREFFDRAPESVASGAPSGCP